MPPSAKIHTAELDWELVDGIEVPISRQFGDVYFSKDNGLLETRHVFLNGNDLTERLSQLNDYQYFCVGETGFGTGLNILALWQLWQQVRPENHSHLHVISVEKFPLSKADLIRALNIRRYRSRQTKVRHYLVGKLDARHVDVDEISDERCTIYRHDDRPCCPELGQIEPIDGRQGTQHLTHLEQVQRHIRAEPVLCEYRTNEHFAMWCHIFPPSDE